MDYMISMFIDNELNLDEKIIFVETIHHERVFKDEAVDLLKQEKRLRSKVVDQIPEIKISKQRPAVLKFPRPLMVTAAAAMILLFVFISPDFRKPDAVPHRFLIYTPDITRVEIAGTFTNWQSIPMNRLGSSGYWEIVLDLPQGEHRFSYILEGNRRMPDPTILTRENDDFGGKNSILYVTT